MNVSVIVPAYNAKDSLPFVLRDLPRAHVHDVIVVDNGSTDQTFRVAQEANVKVVHEPRRGYGQACQSGLRALLPQADVVVFLDGDRSDYSEDLPILLAPIEQGQADLVIGSRVLGQAEPGALTLQQRVGNWLACQVMALRFGRGFTDLGPFRAIRRETLTQLKLRDRGFGWNVEMQVKALKANVRVLEVPVRSRRRIGRSNLAGTLTGIVRTSWAVLWTILRLW